MATLTGAYEHQLDAKNRMRIPAKLKKELGDEFYFAKGIDHCVFIYTKEEVDRITAIASEIKLADPRLKSARMFLKNIVSVKEDDHGRILMSNEMRAHLGLGKDETDLVICGAGSRIEIWSKSNYDSYFGEEDEDYDTLVKNLGI